MKTILVLMIFILPATLTFSQTKADKERVFVPLKDGSIFYENIYELNKIQKEDAYNLSLKWIANAFQDSKEVIRIQNKETGNIVGSGSIQLKSNGFLDIIEAVSFMFEITVKDNKARIRFYQFSDRFVDGNYDYSPTDGRWHKFDIGKSRVPKSDKKFFQELNKAMESLSMSYRDFVLKSATDDSF